MIDCFLFYIYLFDSVIWPAGRYVIYSNFVCIPLFSNIFLKQNQSIIALVSKLYYVTPIFDKIVHINWRCLVGWISLFCLNIFCRIHLSAFCMILFILRIGLILRIIDSVSLSCKCIYPSVFINIWEKRRNIHILETAFFYKFIRKMLLGIECLELNLNVHYDSICHINNNTMHSYECFLSTNYQNRNERQGNV